MDVEQLPCPWCGSANISAGEVLTENRRGRRYTQSQCMDCLALGPAAHLEYGEIDFGDAKAIAAWNNRLAEPAKETT